jgi:hypothetical protein
MEGTLLFWHATDGSAARQTPPRQIRNFEYRNPKQIRNPKLECPKLQGSCFEFGISVFGFVSDFDIRIPDFLLQ